MSHGPISLKTLRSIISKRRAKTVDAACSAVADYYSKLTGIPFNYEVQDTAPRLTLSMTRWRMDITEPYYLMGEDLEALESIWTNIEDFEGWEEELKESIDDLYTDICNIVGSK